VGRYELVSPGGLNWHLHVVHLFVCLLDIHLSSLETCYSVCPLLTLTCFVAVNCMDFFWRGAALGFDLRASSC
jgi:hypothetical protein